VEPKAGKSATVEAPKKRKTRTRVDPSKITDPLDRKLFHLKQATKIVKIGRDLDPESRALAIEMLQELDVKEEA
jgi:hypothetical protein